MYARRFLLIFTLTLFVVQPVYAATLYIDPAQKTLGRGDAEIFQVRLNTNDDRTECINAVSGVLQFSGPLEPVDVSLGASILSIWLEPPTIDINKRQVTFAGGIPNGYCGRIDGDPNLTNVLFEVIARAEVKEGETEIATVSFTTETTAYLNDGLGTLANLTLIPSTLTITPKVNETVADPWSDQVAADIRPPQEFGIILERDALAFAGKYYIAFSTTDKQTGIDHYQVMEEPLSQAGSFSWGRADAPWREITSPYTLKDQTLNSIIRVKALDKAGNEYIATLIPDKDLRTISFDQILTYILVGTLVFGAALVAFIAGRRRKINKVSVAAAKDEDNIKSVDSELEVPKDEYKHDVRQ